MRDAIIFNPNTIQEGYLTWDIHTRGFKYRDGNKILDFRGGVPTDPVFKTVTVSGNSIFNGSSTFNGLATFNAGTLTSPSSNYVGQTTDPPNPARGNSGIFFDQTANTFKRWNPITTTWDILGGGASTLVSLTDTVITNPVKEDAIVWDGTAWINKNITIAPPLPPTVSVTPTQPELQAIQDYIKAIDDLAGTLGITTGVAQPGPLPITPTLAQLQGILDFAIAIDDQFAVLVTAPTYNPSYTKPISRPTDYSGTPSRQQLYDLLNYAIAISNALSTSNVFGAAFPVDSVNGRTGAIMLSLGDVGITPVPEPTVPGNPGATYNKAEVQAILDYSKSIANILKTQGILT